MIRIPCPYCGARNSSEFAYLGELTVRPPAGSTEPAEWRRYLYEKANPAGWTSEKWYHSSGCRKFFVAERHTVTNEVRTTRPFGEQAVAEQGGAEQAGGEARP